MGSKSNPDGGKTAIFARLHQMVQPHYIAASKSDSKKDGA
jgi:hypothetical protein